MDLAKAIRRFEWAQQQQVQARTDLVDALREAKKTHTYEQLGKQIGVSRQRVHQMLSEDK